MLDCPGAISCSGIFDLFTSLLNYEQIYNIGIARCIRENAKFVVLRQRIFRPRLQTGAQEARQSIRTLSLA